MTYYNKDFDCLFEFVLKIAFSYNFPQKIKFRKFKFE